ncbi:MAG: SRPBCC domain-containing protein [Phyllobacterium sp.]
MTRTTESDAERELILVREFNAPRELVFRMWTDPKHVAEWWGPHGFTNPVVEMDVRPGGKYRIVMRDANGVDYPSKGKFIEVAEPERLVVTDAFDMEDAPADEAVWTIIFEDIDGRTRLTIRLLCKSAKDRRTLVEMGWREGTTEMLEKLEAYMAGL